MAAIRSGASGPRPGFFGWLMRAARASVMDFRTGMDRSLAQTTATATGHAGGSLKGACGRHQRDGADWNRTAHRKPAAASRNSSRDLPAAMRRKSPAILTVLCRKSTRRPLADIGKCWKMPTQGRRRRRKCAKRLANRNRHFTHGLQRLQCCSTEKPRAQVNFSLRKAHFNDGAISISEAKLSSSFVFLLLHLRPETERAPYRTRFGRGLSAPRESGVRFARFASG